MSVSNGPGIVTSGLVFHYDMGNPSKSYIGQPTTNLSYNNGQGNSEYLNSPQTWTNSGAWSLNSNETDIPLPNFPHAGSLPSNLRILSGVITSASTQGCQFGCGYTTVSPSTTYTMSVYYRQNRAMANNAMPYLRTNVNNNSIASFSYNGNYSQWTWPVNQWIRISATGTTQSNENGLYLSQYFGEFVGDKIWMCGHQVEAVSYATPLVAGTRSNSQAIVDLTGNNTITANSLTYNNDNTFSFNGSNYATISSFVNKPTSAITCEAWIYPSRSGVGTGTIRGGAISSSNSMYLGIIDSTDGGNTFSMHWANQTSNSRVYNWNGSIPNNAWSHLVGTYDGSTARAYLNGVEIWSQSQTGTIPDASYGIGYYQPSGLDGTHPFIGKLGNSRIYNRALTASEVRQNFSALRSRYGI